MSRLASGAQMMRSSVPGAALTAAPRLAGTGGGRCCRLVTASRTVVAAAAARDVDVRTGDLVTGRVDSIAGYGAFVRLEGGATALLHISQISQERVESVDGVFQVGDTIKALVQSVDRQRGRIGLSTKKLEDEPGDMLRDAASVYAKAEGKASAARGASADALSGLSAGDLVSGTVESVAPFGAFVKLDGGGATGLVHISAISQERVESVDDVFQAGDSVKALVRSVDRQRGRLSLSTKRLEEQPGDMLRDPQRVFANAEKVAARLADEDDDE